MNHKNHSSDIFIFFIFQPYAGKIALFSGALDERIALTIAQESGYVGCKAAHEVWKALGVPDRFGYSILGAHTHCELPNSQRPEGALPA